MNRAVKISLIILGSIVALILLMVACTGLWVTQAVKEVADAAMEPGAQQVQVNDGGIRVTVPIVAKSGAVLAGVKLCTPEGAPRVPNRGFGTSSSCVNGVCETVLEFGDSRVPAEVTIHREHNGKCVEQTITDIARYLRTTSREAQIVLTEKVLADAGVPEALRTKMERTPNSRFGGHGMLSFGSDVRFDLSYDGIPPQQDEFRLGETLVTVTLTVPPVQPQP